MSVQETKLSAIADAIRESEGSSEPICANDFAARIRALQTGGGGACGISVMKDTHPGKVVFVGVLQCAGAVTVYTIPHEVMTGG